MIPWTLTCLAPLSMGFSRQKHWSGQPFPSPGDFPDPRIESESPALQADSLLSEPPGKHSRTLYIKKKKAKFTLALIFIHILTLIKHYLSILYVDCLQVKPLVWIPCMKECRVKYLKEKDTCLKSEDFFCFLLLSPLFIAFPCVHCQQPTCLL